MAFGSCISSANLTYYKQKFKKATLVLSESSNTFPLLPSIIPTYNWILDRLDDIISKYQRGNDEDKDQLLRGLVAAWVKVKKWYARTTRSIYRNVMCECFSILILLC